MAYWPSCVAVVKKLCSGDAVYCCSRESNPTISAFMTAMGYGKDYAKLEGYHIQK